ncbi:hypothetical protein [Shinella pollutisoli]|uniref:Secreted protein n=1 Tax=Shinella pollutisoli TaxID=2250594 RepID=A0ABV7DHA7_9HYPH|nr:hypothetical protein [Shinella pollutisoli]
MMVVLLRVVLVVLAVLSAPAGRASAQPAASPDLADRVGGREDLTFADLVRLVAPRIAASGEAARLRHIGGEEWRSAGPEAAELRAFTAVPARSGGSDRMVLLLDFGEARDSAAGFAVLALFDIAGEPRLLDAADVAFDRRTSFAGPVRLPVGEAGDLLVTRSTHFNSSQGYAMTALILLGGDRFELVDTISTLDDRACAFKRTQRLDIRRGTAAPFADIRATVTERTAGTAEPCDDGAAVPEPGTRTIAVTYRWDAAERRYIADSDAFAVLARENETRF